MRLSFFDSPRNRPIEPPIIRPPFILFRAYAKAHTHIHTCTQFLANFHRVTSSHGTDSVSDSAVVVRRSFPANNKSYPFCYIIIPSAEPSRERVAHRMYPMCIFFSLVLRYILCNSYMTMGDFGFSMRITEHTLLENSYRHFRSFICYACESGLKWLSKNLFVSKHIKTFLRFML